MLKKVITAFLCFYCVNILAGRSSSGIDGTTKIAVSAFKEKRVAFSVRFSAYFDCFTEYRMYCRENAGGEGIFNVFIGIDIR